MFSAIEEGMEMVEVVATSDLGVEKVLETFAGAKKLDEHSALVKTYPAILNIFHGDFKFGLAK